MKNETGVTTCKNFAGMAVCSAANRRLHVRFHALLAGSPPLAGFLEIRSCLALLFAQVQFMASLVVVVALVRQFRLAPRHHLTVLEGDIP